MPKDKDEGFSVDVGMSPETILKVADLGRRVEARKERNLKGAQAFPTLPKSPLGRNRSLDEEVGLDHPIYGSLTTPRSLSDSSDTLARPARRVTRSRSLAGRRS